VAHRPAHKGRKPSLSIDVGRDGRVLLDCLGACPIDEVLKACRLMLVELFTEVRSIAPNSGRTAGGDRIEISRSGSAMEPQGKLCEVVGLRDVSLRKAAHTCPMGRPRHPRDRCNPVGDVDDSRIRVVI
jgi:hypothetical protein